MPERWTDADFVGGCLCLDFANTVDDRVDPAKFRDKLASFADLVSWAEYAGVIDAASARKLHTTAPKTAGKALDRALRLRETLHRIFSGLCADSSPNSADIRDIFSLLAGAGPLMRLTPAGTGLAPRWRFDRQDAFGLILPIALSANELLFVDKLDRLRRCPRCGWLFMDSSKSGRRRWCDMKTCGNRAKVARHRREHAKRVG